MVERKPDPVLSYLQGRTWGSTAVIAADDTLAATIGAEHKAQEDRAHPQADDKSAWQFIAYLIMAAPVLVPPYQLLDRIWWTFEAIHWNAWACWAIVVVVGALMLAAAFWVFIMLPKAVSAIVGAIYCGWGYFNYFPYALRSFVSPNWYEAHRQPWIIGVGIFGLLIGAGSIYGVRAVVGD